MRCPHCQHDAPDNARYCPECGQPLGIAAGVRTLVDVHPEVRQNLGNVIGVQTQAIHGDVYGGEIYEVQVFALSDAGRQTSWRRFLDAHTLPYKFLSPYTAQDRALFKGRDAETEQVVRRIGEQRLLVVYGQAGVGKTSLLAAGVIPELAQFGALVVHIRDYQQPVETIRAALAASADRIALTLPAESTLPALVRAVQESTQGTLILVLDQFERFFAPAGDTDRRTAFIDGLAESLETVAPEYLRLILAVEEDTLGHLGDLQRSLPDLLRSPFQLLPLTHQQAQAAIEEPLAELDYPVSFVGNLVAEFLVPDLDDLTPKQPGQIYPPHLQIVCHWLYQAARDRHPPHIDTKLYVNRGRGADGIMARYMDETLRTQLAGQQDLAQRVLVTMASPGTEQWVSPKQLPRDGASPEQLSQVLSRLAEVGLLIQRRVNGRQEYGFVSSVVTQEVRRLAGPEVERRYQAEDELERIWSAWLARDALATQGQLRYLAEAGAHLTPPAVRTLLLLRSSVAREMPAAPWLAWLRHDQGQALIRQLEEPDAPDLAQRSSRSTLNKAALLLGLHDAGRGEAGPTDSAMVDGHALPPASPLQPDQPGDERPPFGPVAWSAVAHRDWITRQTAALALTAMDRHQALDRLEWALRALEPRRLRWRRRAELRGALADADPEVEELNADLPALDRAGIWWWRVRRRIIRHRHRIAGLTLGGAIGAGLGLALLRGITAALTQQTVGLQMSVEFYLGAILGAAVTLGMALAEHLLLKQSEPTGDTPPIWRAPLHPDRLPAVLAVALGTLFFGLAHVFVIFSTGSLSLSGKSLPIEMGFVAGLGLSLGLYGLPLHGAGRRQGIGHWLLRLGTAALLFVLVHQVFIALGYIDRSIPIIWPGSTYRAELTRYENLRWWQQFIDRYPKQWFNFVARLDAALVGTVLTVGTAVGLRKAAAWLARWQNLVERAGE